LFPAANQFYLVMSTNWNF